MFALFIQKLCERRHSPKKFSLRLVIGGACQQGDFTQPWPLVRWRKNETLVRRGKKWFRYDAPDKRLFKKLQKTLMTSPG